MEMDELDFKQPKKIVGKLISVDVLDKIRTDIAEDLSNAEKESRYTQDDIDCGISVGLKRALDIIDKYTKGESEIWNTPNADNRIVAPKGTFKKIYEDEDDDNDI